MESVGPDEAGSEGVCRSCRRPRLPQWCRGQGGGLQSPSHSHPMSSPPAALQGTQLQALPCWGLLQGQESSLSWATGSPAAAAELVSSPSLWPELWCSAGLLLRGHLWLRKGEERLPPTQLSAGKTGNRFQMFRRQERRSGPLPGQLKGEKRLLTLLLVRG